MSWFGFGKGQEQKVYKERDLKAHFKTCLIRVNLRKTKTINGIQKAKKDIANLLIKGDDENARVLVEQIIKDEFLCEAFEELTAMLEESQARIGMISTSKRLPIGMRENICTLIWVSQHIDIKEFGLIRQQLALKFGNNLDNEAICNIDNCVNHKIIDYLSPNPPEEVLVFSYLKTIANENQIEWKAQELEDIPTNEPTFDSEFSEFASNESDFANALFFDRKIEEFSGAKEKGNKIDVTTENIDEFDSMFASIPDNGHSIQPAVIQSSNAPIIQKIVKLEPSFIQSNLSAPVLATQPLSITPISPISTKKPAITPIALSDKELEDEFEQLFNSTSDSIPELKSAPSVVLSPTPVVNSTPVQVVSTGTSNEYADLFSAAPITSNKPMGGVKLPALVPSSLSLKKTIDSDSITPTISVPDLPSSSNSNSDTNSDFSDIFARLASMNAPQSPVPQEELNKNSLSDSFLEWESQFNQSQSINSISSEQAKTTSDFNSQSKFNVLHLPASSVVDEDDSFEAWESQFNASNVSSSVSQSRENPLSNFPPVNTTPVKSIPGSTYHGPGEDRFKDWEGKLGGNISNDLTSQFPSPPKTLTKPSITSSVPMDDESFEAWEARFNAAATGSQLPPPPKPPVNNEFSSQVYKPEIPIGDEFDARLNSAAVTLSPSIDDDLAAWEAQFNTTTSWNSNPTVTTVVPKTTTVEDDCDELTRRLRALQ